MYLLRDTKSEVNFLSPNIDFIVEIVGSKNSEMFLRSQNSEKFKFWDNKGCFWEVKFLTDLKKVTLLSRSFNFSKTSGSFNFSKTELIISEFWLLLKNFSELWDKSNFDTVLLPKIKRMWSLSKRFEIESSERSKKK